MAGSAGLVEKCGVGQPTLHPTSSFGHEQAPPRLSLFGRPCLHVCFAQVAADLYPVTHGSIDRATMLTPTRARGAGQRAEPRSVRGRRLLWWRSGHHRVGDGLPSSRCRGVGQRRGLRPDYWWRSARTGRREPGHPLEAGGTAVRRPGPAVAPRERTAGSRQRWSWWYSLAWGQTPPCPFMGAMPVAPSAGRDAHPRSSGG